MNPVVPNADVAGFALEIRVVPDPHAFRVAPTTRRAAQPIGGSDELEPLDVHPVGRFDEHRTDVGVVRVELRPFTGIPAHGQPLIVGDTRPPLGDDEQRVGRAVGRAVVVLARADEQGLPAGEVLQAEFDRAVGLADRARRGIAARRRYEQPARCVGARRAGKRSRAIDAKRTRLHGVRRWRDRWWRAPAIDDHLHPPRQRPPRPHPLREVAEPSAGGSTSF